MTLCDIEGCNNKGNWASIAIKGRFLPLNVCHDCYQIKTTVRGNNSIVNVPNLYEYINGNIIYDNKLFEGNVEYLEDEIQPSGILQYKFKGRDRVSDVLDIVVNHNFTHTSDYIYTTNNPTNDLTTVIFNSNANTVNIKDFTLVNINYENLFLFFHTFLLKLFPLTNLSNQINF